MPGVFISVVQEPGNLFQLSETDGGPPHITIFWCPKGLISNSDLQRMNELTEYVLYRKSLSISTASINSFTKESVGKTRYDLLLSLDQTTNQLIESLRTELKTLISDEVISACAFRTPHLTAATEWELEVTEQKLMALKPHLSELHLSFGLAYN